MAVRIDGEFLGGVATRMTHGPSGVTIETDPPVDNGGSGASFSPTDLFATAYGSCMMSIMAMLAKKEGWDLSGMSMTILKHMTPTPPRRVAKLEIDLSLPAHLSGAAREALIHAGRTCPVALSVSADVQVDLRTAQT